MSAKTRRQVFCFGPSRVDGNASMRRQLGGKGANLAEMARIGLPIPAGFTIGTSACLDYLQAGGQLPTILLKAIDKALRRLQKDTGRRFADLKKPLLLSVRSGAAISMPGMMDTVLNLGLNDDIVEAMARRHQSRRFALDAYRRLVQMFGEVVMQVPHEDFEQAMQACRQAHGAATDAELGDEALERLITEYKAIYRRHAGECFPQDPHRQLLRAIEAVFRSWNTPRAISYRRIHGISEDLGTAVNVQMMVFGNLGEDSATGVAFTRNPATGSNDFYGEFLVNAQGEDVVAGIRTPQPVAALKDWNGKVYKQLLKIKKTLERHCRDMQDIEFTIEQGRLYMLQTRTGKRTAAAALHIAVDLVAEGKINKKTALLRIDPLDLNQLLHPSFDPAAKRTVLARGLPASPGAAVGRLAFSAAEVVERHAAGEQLILVRQETSAEDVEGMHAAAGILTATGGTTSHAAVVARGWGKCCITGVSALEIDAENRKLRIGKRELGPDDVISIDGTSGEVMVGSVATREAEFSGDFATIMAWADKYRRLGIRTNADKPADAEHARRFGAEGIGLCRTEHMFFEGHRIDAMREMILADGEDARCVALEKLLPYQRDDFIGLLTAMKGLPVIIRLLDPPLHEFLPRDASSQAHLARQMGITQTRVRRRVAELEERNPMLGHRGCRLAITYPEILAMQVQAITEATIHCRRKRIPVQPEIMVPLVGFARELQVLRGEIEATIEATRRALRFRGVLEIPVGTMIELPRAAVCANEIAEVADFFSFGTNDLTQMTLGFSRDDVNGFLPDYLERHILASSPFQTLDTQGVGQLVRMAVKRGRKTCKGLSCGICGEHGGDPASIAFCHQAGLDYVSCSPFRVPIARLAAAQAAIRQVMTKKE